ncbi:DUF4402 domain-containing protein, partial [Lactobacillus sp. XV13L]|nr:DUF4402 domain-containing protein [Lactobacillus sp. XV13L]
MECRLVRRHLDRRIDNGSDRQAQVTFRNIDFHGSQLIYCSNQTHIKFEGTNSAETVAIPYPGTTVSFTNNQQLFQFTGSNNSIEFNGKFTGTTYAGNVIEMAGSNNTITVAKGATVTLNPAGNLSTNLGFNPGENTATMFAIYMGGTGQKINVGGTLNINVGQADYAGTYDYKQASGIYM